MDKLFHSWFGWWFIAFMLYSITVITYGVRAQTQAQAGWQVGDKEETLVFRKPRALRRSTLMIPGVFFLMLIPNLLAAPPHHRYGQYEITPTPQQQLTRILIKGYMAASVLSLSLLFVYMSGPSEMRLDGRRRVYEKMEGWPWRPKTSRGFLDDYKGICITPRNSIQLVPRYPSRRLISGNILSNANSKQAAQMLAEEVSRITGIPLIDCPVKR